MRLLVATTNRDKIREIRSLLADVPVDLLRCRLHVLAELPEVAGRVEFVDELLLAFGHRRERDTLWGLGNAKNDPGILHWEEALRDQDIQPDRHR